jgi:outer membrane receptor for ferrienterochelin and colicins
MNRFLTTLVPVLFLYYPCLSDGIVSGMVKSAEGPLPYVNIGILGYNFGTYTDQHGNFELNNIPVGEYSIQFSSVGYKTEQKQLNVSSGAEVVLEILLEPSYEQLEEVVVSGSKIEQKRNEATVAVGLIDRKGLELVQANTLADGLNFQTGLRMETDCQTCGYSQLRMNGLGGAYSMILIDSRPIFSSLMGLYGLEMIPANLIERIEVVRGGGSALYGSSSIAGTVNVITREPETDFLSLNANAGMIGNQSFENNLNASASKVFDKAGMTLQLSRNYRSEYDANGDGFSELPRLSGLNFGINSYLKIGKYSTLGFNINGINEYRRGGNKIDEAAHNSDQAEERTHNILMGGVNFKSSMPGINSSISVYLAGQNTNRIHYTGIDQADAYGNTLGNTFMGGFQYNYLSSAHTMTAGVEYVFDYVNDEIPLYNYLIDQETKQLGMFFQDDWKISPKFNLLAGIRMDKHNMVEELVLNPRISLLYKLMDFAQLRASYSTGYRAPQTFDTDLHIAFAGGGVSIIRLDPELTKETSESFSFSLNYDRPSEKYIYGFSIDGFYTKLRDAFVLEEIGSDDQGNMILQKRNSAGSIVRGVSLEGRVNFNSYVELDMGVTFQSSQYLEPVQWSSEMEGSTDYLRTPNDYGYYTLEFSPVDRIAISFSGVYTGSMKVPHFGGAPGVPLDHVITSKKFFDQGIKLSYELPVSSINQGLQFFGGVKNIFNSYQDDFDIGRYRDSNFVYGPARPRTYYLGIRLQTL